ncbi:hypothetical protein HOV17_gp13 [Halorubrum pleomorphic virus 9]|uniref:PGF-CTERM sorting domain-containing protein n=1 Tax=Halorubrum pleomorphic virus 9 TaxID=2126525 RepID=A0A3S7I7J1_9VIRU|nr:hypothetical protein HOV17_gp13 [Halorubrum pleomorphic virus 9]AVP39977.1 hypothetical protein [Halorubrum pleomorphic virus 9]
MNRNTSAALLVAVVAIGAIGLAFAAGGVAGQTNSTELVNDTIDVTNDTESAYVDIVGLDDMNGSGPVSVNVTFEGLNGSETPGNGTVLEETTLSVAENTTESTNVTLSDSDRQTYDSIHITASTGGNASLVDTVNWGTVAMGGGAGAGLDGGTGALGTVAVVLFVVYLVSREE